MPNRNKSTGNDRELRAAKYMRTKGWPKARRRLAGRRLDEGDLENTGPVTWQVKRLKNGASRNLIRKWLQETQKQRKNADTKFGFLLYVQEFKPVDQWSTYCYSLDLAELLHHGGLPGECCPATWAYDVDPIVRLDFGDMLDLLRNAGYADEKVDHGEQRQTGDSTAETRWWLFNP